MVEVTPYVAAVDAQSAIPVSSTVVGAGVTSNNRIAEVNTNTYVLQSASNAALSGKSGVPSWLANAIADSIVDGEVDIKQIITDLDTALRSLVTGVSQQIGSVQTAVESNNTLLTTTVSRLDDDIAGVITLANSKVTPEQASATMATFLEAEFNTPTVTANSWLLDLLNTTSTATGTQALEIKALGSTFSNSNIAMQNTVDANANIVDTRFTSAGIDEAGNLTSTAYNGMSLAAAVDGIGGQINVTQDIVAGVPHIWEQPTEPASTDTYLAGGVEQPLKKGDLWFDSDSAGFDKYIWAGTSFGWQLYQGPTGTSGDFTSYIFARGLTAPTLPATKDFSSTTWTDGTPSGTGTLWMSKAVMEYSSYTEFNFKTSVNSGWSAAVQADAENGTPGFDPYITDNFDGTYTITGSTGAVTFSDGENAVAPTVTESTDAEGRTIYSVQVFNNDGTPKGDPAVLLQPLKNVDYFNGADGSFVSYVFKVSSIAPTAPTNGSFDGATEVLPTLPGIWTDVPTHTTDEVEWVSTRTYTASVATDGTQTWSAGTWSTPKEFYRKGTNGVAKFKKYVFSTSNIKPTNGGYTTAGVFTAPSAPFAWFQDAPNATYTAPVYESHIDVEVDSDGVYTHVDWSAPVKFSAARPELGTDYYDGVGNFIDYVFCATKTDASHTNIYSNTTTKSIDLNYSSSAWKDDFTILGIDLIDTPIYYRKITWKFTPTVGSATEGTWTQDTVTDAIQWNSLKSAIATIWSSLALPTAPTSTDGTATTDWTDNAPIDGSSVWMATSTLSNNVWSEWSVAKIKGEKGNTGYGTTSSYIYCGGQTTIAYNSISIAVSGDAATLSYWQAPVMVTSLEGVPLTVVSAVHNGTTTVVTFSDSSTVNIANSAWYRIPNVTWVANMESLITGDNGAVTGWTAFDGSGTDSQFAIVANNFKIVAADTTVDNVANATPAFSITTDAQGVPTAQFNGKVSFNNVDTGTVDEFGNTTIDGGKITTNSLNANTIIAGTSISSPVINGGTINGGIINGVNIIGSVIKASWIDYTSAGALTNWQFYTPSTVPVEYKDNFAKDNTTGELIVDSLGYVRLPTVVPITTLAVSYLSNSSVESVSSGIRKISFDTYDSYQRSSTTRALSATPTLTNVSGSNWLLINDILIGTSSCWSKAIINVFGETLEVYLSCWYSGGNHVTGYIKKNDVEIHSISNTLTVDVVINSIIFKITVSPQYLGGYDGDIPMELAVRIVDISSTLTSAVGETEFTVNITHYRTPATTAIYSNTQSLNIPVFNISN